LGYKLSLTISPSPYSSSPASHPLGGEKKKVVVVVVVEEEE
jgi:hypothetical protein